MLRQLLQVTSSKVLSSGLAFAFGVAVARLLGPEQYGLLAVSFAVTAVTAELTGYGLETALVRFATPFLQDGQRGRAATTCRLVFRLKLLVNGLLLLTGMALAGPISHLVGNPAYTLPIQAGVAGGLGLSLWRFGLSILQALQLFGTYALVQSANGLLKVSALSLVLLFGGINLPLALLIHVASFFGGFLLGMLLCPRDLLSLIGPNEPDVSRSVFNFSKWIVPASFCSILNAWLGVLVLGYFTAPWLIGQFAAAFTVISSFDILMVSINTVLLPAACAISDRPAGLGFIRKALSVSGLLSVAL
ncbi:MAG: oligosaccharide flippase family protein, partial [Acidobacteriota bacterium]